MVIAGGLGGARRAKDGGETQRVKDKDSGRERNREMSMKEREREQGHDGREKMKERRRG